MNQSRLVRLLMQPSLTSGTFVFMLSAAAVGSTAWTYVSSQQLFYDYVFGAYGFKTYIWQQSQGLDAFKQTALASPAAYYVLVGAAAVAVGLFVYAILQFMGVLFNWRSLTGLDALGPNRKAVARELSRRLALRVVVLAGWAVFSVCFFSGVLPFAALLTQYGVQHIRDAMLVAGIVSLFGAFVLLIVSLHLQVILLRLVCLRPRVFFSADAVEEIEAKSL